MSNETWLIIGLVATIVFMMAGLIAMVLAIRDLYRRQVSFALVFFTCLAAAIYFTIPVLAAVFI